VPYGATIAYRDLATAVGRPASIRAAGAATGRNPLSIFIPCHRIVGADGLSGYAWWNRAQAYAAGYRTAQTNHPRAARGLKRTVRRSDAVRLLALSAIWGSSFIFIPGDRPGARPC
jgi:O-6-methylguanine DNA methyltransferase